MRKLNFATLVLSAVIAVGQEQAARPKEPLPARPLGNIRITPEMLRNLPKLVLPPAGGACAIPLLEMPIPPGATSPPKVVPTPGNVDKIPQMQGLPTCESRKR